VIFGDRDELAIEVERLDTPWNAVDPQDQVWGAIAIWVAGQNLSEHRRHGTDRVRDDLHVPLLPLAHWAISARGALLYEERSPLGAGTSPHEELERWSDGPPPSGVSEDAWLDRRDHWWSEHFTGAATVDAIAPSIGIVRNDDRALVSWRIPSLPRPDRTFSRPLGADSVAWSVVASALDEFVAAVSGWAPPAYRLATDDDPAEKALQYYTGLPEHEITRFGFLPEAARDPASDPLAQVVRDLSQRTAVGPARESIVDSVRSSAQPADRAWWNLRQQLIPAPGISFESDGHSGAQAARSLLGLDGLPIDDFEGLLQSVDVEVCAESPAALSDRMFVAGTASGRAITMILANARTAKPWGRRFELARALGHLLLDQVRGEAIGAASGPQAVASRRRRAGAFAAEILLPTSALEDASEGVLDGILEGDRFVHLLERFGVGASTAAFHLWNQHLLSSTEVRDDLIASAS
jgi:Zn-dependent peptidase ImmA (M78 family)